MSTYNESKYSAYQEIMYGEGRLFKVIMATIKARGWPTEMDNVMLVFGLGNNWLKGASTTYKKKWLEEFKLMRRQYKFELNIDQEKHADRIEALLYSRLADDSR